MTRPSPTEASKPATIRLVLVRPRQSGNIGSVARTMANHGMSDLWVVAPPAFDPEQARWMAPGAEALIDGLHIVPTLSDALVGCDLVVATSARERRWDWPVWGLDHLSRAVATDARVAVLLGPEDTGLSTEDLRLAQAVLRIPTAEAASLNLAHAATRILAAVFDVSSTVAPQFDDEERPLAAPGLLQLAIDDAVGILLRAGYFRGRSEEQSRGTLYRLLARARPTANELGILRGMAKAARHALRPD